MFLRTLTASWTLLRNARVALLAAGLSYYLIAGLLPLLVRGSGLLGVVSRRNSDAAEEVVDWLGVQGHAAAIVTDSIDHTEQTHVTSSIAGVAGLLWAGLAVTGALRRAVDAVWGVEDVGWTARLRSAPWAAVAGLLIALSVAATGIAASLTGFEAVKNGAVVVVPRLVSRDSALYGSLGSALATIVGLLVISWLLLVSTAIAAELTELSTTKATHGSQTPPA